jgi:hypothetical protein
MQNVTAWRKSTRSNASGTNECVELRRSWRKSTRSGTNGTTDCVELAACADDGFHVRDSKLGDNSPVFDLGTADLTALLSSAR